jgi:hypothetical protein
MAVVVCRSGVLVRAARKEQNGAGEGTRPDMIAVQEGDGTRAS